MPKETAFNTTFIRRAALAFGALALVLFVTLLASPSVRAFAGDQIRQIGAIFFTPQETGAVEIAPQPTVAAPPEHTAEYVENAAQAGEIAGYKVLAPSWLPEGYSENAPWSVDTRDGSTYVVSSYRNQDGRSFLLLNQTDFAEGARFDQSISGNETLTDVMVGGNAGVFISGRVMAHPDLHIQNQSEETVFVSTNFLIWESDGITYSLFGDGLTQEQMVRIAESLSG